MTMWALSKPKMGITWTWVSLSSLNRGKKQKKNRKRKCLVMYYVSIYVFFDSLKPDYTASFFAHFHQNISIVLSEARSQFLPHLIHPDHPSQSPLKPSAFKAHRNPSDAAPRDSSFLMLSSPAYTLSSPTQWNSPLPSYTFPRPTIALPHPPSLPSPSKLTQNPTNSPTPGGETSVSSR
jgi:hypothetical protein